MVVNVMNQVGLPLGIPHKDITWASVGSNPEQLGASSSSHAALATNRSGVAYPDGEGAQERRLVSKRRPIGRGSSKNRQLEGALLQPGRSNYTSLLRRCGQSCSLADGKRIHAQIVADGLEQDMLIGNHLVIMYAKCKCPQDARAVFDRMQQRNVFSWTSMITAYAQNGHFKEALKLFQEMEWEGAQPDEVTFVAVSSACSRLGDLPVAQSIHKLVLATGFENNVVVATSLINMYAKCGSLHDARIVFDNMAFKNVITWNSMITAYAQYGRCKDAIKLFLQMEAPIQPNSITFTSLLAACRSIGGLAETKMIHSSIVSRGLNRDVVVGSALINTYAKCGSLEDARRAFDDLNGTNLVCWTAMIGAYTQYGYGKETMQLFRRMDLEGLKVDVVTFVNVLGACSGLGALKEGRMIHARIVAEGVESNDILATALANMYSKCGSSFEGSEAFNRIQHKDTVCWNGMIAAYAQHGDSTETAFQVFREMQLEGVKVSGVTYLSILHACSHKGLLQQGWECFVMMREDDSITPSVEHYRCMVDLLARSGRLDDAQELMSTMPFEPGVVAWKSLLAGCKTHGDGERAAVAAQHAMHLDPALPQPYVMLYNVYADEGGGEQQAQQ